MDWKLINYVGIDDVNTIYKFQKVIPYKLEGTIKRDLPISNLLSFGFSKECVDYKVMDFFEDTNYDDENFYGNLLVINNKYDLNFEYSSNNAGSTLNMFHYKLFNANYISLKDYNYSDLEITLLTKDLFCTLNSDKEIFYCANIIIGINEM